MSTLVLLGSLFILSAFVNLILAVFLYLRRESGAALALASLGLFNAIWNVGFAGALLSTDINVWMRWGDFQYIGVGGLVPSWVIFILLWTRRERFVNPLTMALLSLEGVFIVILLFIPQTHDLVRTMPINPGEPPWRAKEGLFFWAHYYYVILALTSSTFLFVVDLWRRSQVYRAQAIALTFAATFPFVVNVIFNVVGKSSIDLTPIAMTVGIAIMAFGVIRQRLLRLAPIAHSQVVAGLKDAVLVVDAFGSVVESNPSADALIDQLPDKASPLVRRPVPASLEPALETLGERDIRLEVNGRTKDFALQVRDLPDEKGHAGGRLVVLRDITDRRRDELQRTRLLSEQARVADILSRSLRPENLPVVPDIDFAAEYRPAATGHDLGGDFYDVYKCDEFWAFSLGDVSGKGAPAAAVTALARYTLRALTTSRLLSPPLAVKALNRQLLGDEDSERYLTVVHGWCQANHDGSVDVDFVLGGHPQPVLLTAGGEVNLVGATGTAVGLINQIELSPERVRLTPGDALVFYTDGVTEARRGRAFFGEQGLLDHVATLRAADAHEIAASILNAALDFQHRQPADDTAVLVIQAPYPHGILGTPTATGPSVGPSPG